MLVSRHRVAVAGRLVRLDFAVVIVPGVVEAERLQDPLPEDIVVFLARHIFDDLPENEIARIVVRPVRARLELERHVPDDFDKLVRRERVTPLFLNELGKSGIARNPRGVVQEVVDHDLRTLLCRIAGQIGGDRGVEFDFAFLDQLQNDRRGEVLRHRADPVFRVRRIRHFPLDVRPAESVLVNHLAGLGDEHRAVELPGVVKRPHDLVDLRGVGTGRRAGSVPGILRRAGSRNEGEPCKREKLYPSNVNHAWISWCVDPTSSPAPFAPVYAES